MSSNTSHRMSRSNQGILYYDTVQTSWRPQLPLPKEIPAQLVQNSAAMETKSTKKETPPNKKWSFGRFFRKKKELDSDTSSDDDHKAGFVAQTQKPRKKEKRKRGSKLISPGFDHIVINPKNGETNELFLPFEAIDTTESIRSSGSADRRGRREKRNRTGKQQTQRSSSSDDDGRSHNSHNSSSLLRYRSDESLGSGGVVGSRRSRAARTERYYKRMSRDENLPAGVVPQQVGRWKTQPVQMGDYDYNRSSSHGHYLKNSNSLSNVPNAQQYIYAVPNKANKTNPVSSEKRSISFENHIHLQNHYDKGDGSIKSMPPPPPPRDPLRRVQVPGQTDLRPISYAFDKAAASTHLYKMNNRCVSDDKLWGPEGSIYQTNFHRPSSVQPAQQPRRFISRADRDVNQPPAVVNGVPGVDFKYIADAVPRSRKPIHILKAEQAKLEPSPNSAFTTPPPVVRTTKSGLPSPMKAASQFWRQIDQQEKHRREQGVDRSKPNVGEKPRSLSTSRAMPGSGPRSSSYENFRAFNGKINKSVDELDNVVSGNLYLKPTKDNEKSFMEVTTKPSDSKSKSMPNYYQQQRLSLQQDQHRQQQRMTQTPPLNKYEEYIARRAPQNVVKPVKVPPPPPQRKSMKISTEDLRKPTTNLEDAINELEAIYKSLKLGDEDLMDRAERRDIPTPTNFEKYAVVSDEDEEINTAEPDIVLDDVAYRNMKRANTMIKTIEPQPPFGIPVGPVPPSPNTDYLHVTPDKDQKKSRRAPQNIPDLITDDLAVRNLRKDVPGMTKPTVDFTPGSSKKKRAARSMSANIYNLIQRDAAKPSGGNLYDYADVDRALEKAGSLTDVRKEVDDIPSTFQLLKSLRRQESEGTRKSSPVFRHPSHGGAVFNLPSTLSSSPGDSPHILQKPPIPLPRKSHSPEPMHNTKGMEEVLNRIAREAKESSEKLSKELKELRTEKLLSVEKPMKPEMSKLEKEIEEASKAAKVCEEILLSVLPKSEPLPAPKPRKLMKEDEFVRKIEETSEAARYCEKLLKDVVAVEPPVKVETAQTVSQAVSEIQDFVSGKVDTKSDLKEPMKVSVAVDPSPVEVDLIDFSDDTEPDKQGPLTVSRLLQNVHPFKSEEIGKLTERCMRQISDLQAEAAVQESKGKGEDEGDYDNLNSEPETSNIVTCKQDADDIPDYDNIHGDHAVVSERNDFSEAMAPLATQDDDEEDIDRIMKECEEQVMSKTPYTSLSSSDCPKSSSPASSRHKSSSITSIHAFSSSDFVKSSSSDFHTPSTDPIKTFSTTSYDVNSSSPTPNITNSPVSTTPSPLLALTPISKNIVGEVDDGQSRSQYDSSEELAMIFGMTATPSTIVAPIALPSENASTITSVATTATTESIAPKPYQPAVREVHKLSSTQSFQPLFQSTSSSTTAKQSCQQPSHPQSKLVDISPPLNDSYKSVYNTSSQLITNDNKKFSPFDSKPSKESHSTHPASNFPHPASADFNLANPASSPDRNIDSERSPVVFSCVNFRPTKSNLTRTTSNTADIVKKNPFRTESRPRSTLYDIICKEKEIELNMSSADAAISKEGKDKSENPEKVSLSDGGNATDGPLLYQPSANLFKPANFTHPKNDSADHHSLPADDSGGRIKRLNDMMSLLEDIRTKPSGNQAETNSASFSTVMTNEGKSLHRQQSSPSKMPMPKGNLNLASELNHNSINVNINNNNDDSNININSRISGSTATASSNGHANLASNNLLGSSRDRDGGRSERIAKYKEERRKQLSASCAAPGGAAASALASDNSDKCDQQNNSVSSGNLDSERKTTSSRPDSLTGVGKRYITRSSRTPVSSDSSSSPVNALLANTTRSAKSPLKSPSRLLTTTTSASMRNSSPVHLRTVRSGTSPLKTSSLRTSPATQSPTHSSGLSSSARPRVSSPPSSGCRLQSTSTTSTAAAPQSQSIRTTKASRLRAAALIDKKSKDSSDEPATRHSPKAHLSLLDTATKSGSEPPTAVGAVASVGSSASSSPLHRIRIGVQAARKANTISGLPSGLTIGGGALTSSLTASSSSSMAPSTSATKKLFPTISVSVKQTLNELSIDGSRSLSNSVSPAPPGRENVSPGIRSPDTECTVKVGQRSLNAPNTTRTSGLSPTTSDRTSSTSPSASERDKSSKRKSNLNRALNEESIKEDDAALRRRRRRELGMARQLIPTDDTSSAIRDAISPVKNSTSPSGTTPSPRNDLAFHMANARKEVRSGSSDQQRQRASTASPKINSSSSAAVKVDVKVTRKSPDKSESVPLNRSSVNKEPDYLRKNKKLSDITRKVDAVRERPKSDLAEINRLMEQFSEINARAAASMCAAPSEPIPSVSGVASTSNYHASNEIDSDSNRKFAKKDRISFDEIPPDDAALLHDHQPSPRKMLEARSHDREVSPEMQGALGKPKISPVFRRKSSEDQAGPSHIVSILKKKDHPESSSASSNASPVTFSSSVMDTPTRSSKRQGILKKRSSLDESRYSRSHSPDEKSILVRTPRRNSLEEIHHGILKQRSYESKSDGCPSAEPHHGILKKKDSMSTPSDSQPKHVSISQAVILAAAELCKDVVTTDSDYDIKPILKTDMVEVMPSVPKPILKKKHSADMEEIRPILKTSRKSSREESDTDELVRPILRIDSPAKRRSLVDSIESNTVLQRSRSLEHSEDHWEPAPGPSSGVVATEKPIVSVAERVRNMERFIIDGSSGAVPKYGRTSNIKRDMYKSRFRTQPVTVDEISCLHSTSVDLFKPGSLEFLTGSLKTSPRSTSSYSPSSTSSRPITDQNSPNSVSAELNCLSLSSDSGLQTGKVSEMSGYGDNISTSSAASATPTTKSLASESSLSTAGGGIVKEDTTEDDSLTKYDSLEDKEFAKDNDNSGEMDKDKDKSESSPTGGATGLARNNSVRARASMFQQLEERMKHSSTTDEKPLPPKVRKVPTTPVAGETTPVKVTPTDAAKTGSGESDNEFEPSTLPLSERLKIFSGERPILQSNNSRTSPIARSHTTSSVDKLQESSNTVNEVQEITKLLDIPVEPDPLATTPKSSAPKRLRLRTVGKITLPTFFDANNNDTSCSSNEKTDEYYPRKIGKIKSPFLENTNNKSTIDFNSMKVKTPTPTKVITELNFDSGKENYDSNHSDISRKLHRSISKEENGSVNASIVDEKLAKYFGVTQTSKDVSDSIMRQKNSKPNETKRSNSAVILEVLKKQTPRQFMSQPQTPTEPHNPILDTILRSEGHEDTSAKKRRSFGSRRNRAMTTIVNNTPDKTPKRMSLRHRAMTVTNGRPLSLLNPQNMITRYEDLHVTKEDLLTAAKEFEQIFLEMTRSSTSSAKPPPPPLLSALGSAFESRKGILKSKSGCVGMFPTDLSSELKNRLKKSTHATVSNLRKSATTEQPIPRLSADILSKKTSAESGSDSESDDGVDPQKNLAKILRSVSKDNMNKTSSKTPQPLPRKTVPESGGPSTIEASHGDAINLVRNLASLEKKGSPTEELKENAEAIVGVMSTSEGESSGGREISSIIKNGAVARRRKLNEG